MADEPSKDGVRAGHSPLKAALKRHEEELRKKEERKGAQPEERSSHTGAGGEPKGGEGDS